MSATFFGGEVKYTKRYKLGQLLATLTRNFLLLTATPHNGKEADFQLFMALLDGDRFEGRFRDGVHTADVSDLMRRMVKEKLLKFDKTPLFPERIASTVPFKLSNAEARLYKEVTEYVREEFNRAEALQNDKRAGTVGFALTILQRRLASSPEAIHESLRRRRERLEKRQRELELLQRGAFANPPLGTTVLCIDEMTGVQALERRFPDHWGPGTPRGRPRRESEYKRHGTQTVIAAFDGGKEKAEAFFFDGMTRAMHRLAEQVHPAFPVTIYYAFKQSESDGIEGTTSTGWETFLDAVVRAGFATSGTWPMRTELGNRMRGTDSNALASSIVLVCRPRAADAPTAPRREFGTALKAELPPALSHLQRGNIAPVDLAQAAIGPGMAVYTRYAKVLDAEGKPLTVREALALINQTLDEALAEQEGDFDADSRWALTWFEQSGFADGEYGVAEQLSKSKNTSVAGMVEAGILESGRGKVRLLPARGASRQLGPLH